MNKNALQLGFLLESQRECISKYFPRDYSNESNNFIIPLVTICIFPDVKIHLTYTSKKKKKNTSIICFVSFSKLFLLQEKTRFKTVSPITC